MLDSDFELCAIDLIWLSQNKSVPKKHLTMLIIDKKKTVTVHDGVLSTVWSNTLEVLLATEIHVHVYLIHFILFFIAFMSRTTDKNWKQTNYQNIHAQGIHTKAI